MSFTLFGPLSCKHGPRGQSSLRWKPCANTWPPALVIDLRSTWGPQSIYLRKPKKRLQLFHKLLFLKQKIKWVFVLHVLILQMYVSWKLSYNRNQLIFNSLSIWHVFEQYVCVKIVCVEIKLRERDDWPVICLLWILKNSVKIFNCQYMQSNW